MKTWYLPIGFLVLGLLVSYYLGFTPVLVGVIYFFCSIVSYCLYAKDKWAAKNGHWRVQENTLHLSALVCGWPGAIIAQQGLRHKTQKASFRVVFVITLLLNLSLLGWLHTADASQKLRHYINTADSWAVNQFGVNKGTTILLALTKFHRQGK